MPPVTVRSYQPQDRAGVRSLCCDTGNLGEPVDGVVPDREIFADLLTRYYTDYEPQSTWVAASGGAVGGYLTGCLDNRRYQRVMRWHVVPQAVGRGLARGLLVHPTTWRLIGAAVRTLQIGGWSEPSLAAPFPAHLHLNLRREWRGRQLGAQLVNRFVSHAAARGVRGVCAAVRGDNLPACRFFQRLGFQELHRHPVAWPSGSAEYRQHDRIIYAKAL